MKKSRMHIGTLFIALVCLVALLAACAQSTPGANGSRNGLVGKGPSPIIKIGLNLPLSGTDASLGQSAENGANLAISQANAAKTLPGYTLQFVAKDDANASGRPDAATGATNVEALIQDAQVAGIIGPFDTTTAEAELPIANQAPIVMLSPSATYTCLTQANAAAGCGTLLHTLRPTGKTTFFRLAPTDTQQGAVQADFAFHTLGERTVYVIDDTSAYGTALANGFSSRFQADFGTVVSHASVGVTPSYENLLTHIAIARPDAIFYAGSDSEGTAIRQQITQIPGLQNTPFLGGNGIHTIAFASAIAPLGGGTVWSTAPAIMPTTGTFVQQYQAKYGALGTYSAAGYDSVNILLAAIKLAVAHKVTLPTSGNQANTAAAFRKSIIGYVAQTNYTSVTGVQYTFTANGDALNNTIEIDTLNSSAQWTERMFVPVVQGQ